MSNLVSTHTWFPAHGTTMLNRALLDKLKPFTRGCKLPYHATTSQVYQEILDLEEGVRVNNIVDFGPRIGQLKVGVHKWLFSQKHLAKSRWVLALLNRLLHAGVLLQLIGSPTTAV